MKLPRLSVGAAAFWLTSALGAVLVAVLVLASAGVVPVQSAERGVLEPPAETAPSPPAPEPPPPATTEQPARQASASSPPPPAQVTVVVAAARGDSWISARVGSESGRLLEERLLPQGETARLTARRVWLLVGASANVDVSVDGERHELAPGTVETVLGPPAR